MSRFISVIVIIFILEKVHHSAGYKWIALKSGDPLPRDAIILDRSLDTYVGRAQHFNLLLPAEVSNDSYARIYSCSKEIVKHQFEVLVAKEYCEWKNFDNYETIPENIVRVGRTSTGEPTFIGKAGYRSMEDYSYIKNFEHIFSILLTTQESVGRKDEPLDEYILICDDQSIWVDTSVVKIPNNAIAGGKSEHDNDIFVARFLKECDIIPGQVIPDLGISTAVDFNGNQMHSFACQVLVGDPNGYSWIPASDGEIPDYAVVVSKIGTELVYVSRTNNALGYIRYKYLQTGMKYEVLVRNVE